MDHFNHQPRTGSSTPILIRHLIHPTNSHQGVVIHSHEAERVVLVAVGGHGCDFNGLTRLEEREIVRAPHTRLPIQDPMRAPHAAHVAHGDNGGVTRLGCPHDTA